jgi:hypothetical protein
MQNSPRIVLNELGLSGKDGIDLRKALQKIANNRFDVIGNGR